MTETTILVLAEAGAPAVTAPPYLAEKALSAHHRSRRRRQAAAVGLVGLLAVGGSVAARSPGESRFVAVYMPSGSMGSTVAMGETLIADRTLSPTYGDVVAMDYTALGISGQTIRRVIGLPGDAIACPAGTDGRCHGWMRNGTPLVEPYAQGADGEVFPQETVGEGQVFVLGDLRDNAVDSRMWGLNGVPEARLADIFAVGVQVRGENGEARPIPGAPAHEGPDGHNVDPAERPTTASVPVTEPG